MVRWMDCGVGVGKYNRCVSKRGFAVVCGSVVWSTLRVFKSIHCGLLQLRSIYLLLSIQQASKRKRTVHDYKSDNHDMT